MGVKRFDRQQNSRPSGGRDVGGGRANIRNANLPCIAAAAFSVLSATLASAKPPSETKPVATPKADVAANVGNALVVRVPTHRETNVQPKGTGTAAATRNDAQPRVHGANVASDTLLKTAVPAAFGFVKPIATRNAGPAIAAGSALPVALPAGSARTTPRIMSNGSTLSIVSMPTAGPRASTILSLAPMGGRSLANTISAPVKATAQAPGKVSNAAIAGGVAFDGTLGSAGALTPDANGVYLIQPTDGKRVGGNLFYSFSTFGLASGYTASFTPSAGSQPVRDVFARVTGSSASSIDGTLQCTIPGANLYLINPHGITFGAGAALDLQGSFAVSTSNNIALGSAGNFNATTPSASILTADAPSAFGFTTSSPPASIIFNGSQLAVSSGKTLAVAGGPVQFASAALQASAGRISIASVSAAGKVLIDPTTLDLTAASSSVPLGAVSLTDSLLIGDGPIGGAIHVVSGSLMLDNSAISSATTGAGTGSPINIAVAGPVTLNSAFIVTGTNDIGHAGNIQLSADSLALQAGGIISSSTSGAGPAGNVSVGVSGAVLIAGADSLQNPSGIYAEAADPSSIANAGNIELSSGSLMLQGGGRISTSNFGLGDGGNVKVSVSGAALITGTDSASPPLASGIYTEANGSGPGSGAGSITLTAGSLTLQAGGTLTSTTFDAGRAGDITVNVSGTTLIGEPSANAISAIYADATGTGQGSGAGNITLSSASLTLQAGGALSSSTFGSGNGGNITATVTGDALITDGSSGLFTNSMTSHGGNAGSIVFDAGSLKLLAGGTITSSTFGTGAGGNVAVNVSGDALISGVPSRINAVSTASQGGDAGNIMFSAGSLTVQAGGAINSSTGGSGMGGSVDVAVSGAVVLDTLGAISAQAKSGATGNAGNLTLTANNLQILNGSLIDSSAFGTGNGGNVTVKVAGTALITGPDSAISATSNTSQAGNAGNITMEAGSLTLQTGGRISSSTAGLGKGGNVTVTVAGPALISGEDSSALGSGIYANTYASSPHFSQNVEFLLGKGVAPGPFCW